MDDPKFPVQFPSTWLSYINLLSSSFAVYCFQVDIAFYLVV